MNIKFSGPKEKTLKKYQTKEIGKYEHFLTEVTVSVHPFLIGLDIYHHLTKPILKNCISSANLL